MLPLTSSSFLINLLLISVAGRNLFQDNHDLSLILQLEEQDGLEEFAPVPEKVVNDDVVEDSLDTNSALGSNIPLVELSSINDLTDGHLLEELEENYTSTLNELQPAQQIKDFDKQSQLEQIEEASSYPTIEDKIELESSTFDSHSENSPSLSEPPSSEELETTQHVLETLTHPITEEKVQSQSTTLDNHMENSSSLSESPSSEHEELETSQHEKQQSSSSSEHEESSSSSSEHEESSSSSSEHEESSSESTEHEESESTKHDQEVSNQQLHLPNGEHASSNQTAKQLMGDEEHDSGSKDTWKSALKWIGFVGFVIGIIVIGVLIQKIQHRSRSSNTQYRWSTLEQKAD